MSKKIVKVVSEYNEARNVVRNIEVIAWMPLPEAYKESEEE